MMHKIKEQTSLKRGFFWAVTQNPYTYLKSLHSPNQTGTATRAEKRLPLGFLPASEATPSFCLAAGSPWGFGGAVDHGSSLVGGIFRNRAAPVSASK
jgi:hypothetical protein